MNPINLLRIKVLILSITSLGIAWQTTMSGVKWDSMGWEEHSCLIFGIIVLWGQTLGALFDKTAAEANQYRIDNGKQAADSVKQ